MRPRDALPRAYRDRTEAGQELAGQVARLELAGPPVVLALPRGGVPVALPVARALRAPLDVLVVRKIGAPWQPEFALGAIASGGIVLRDAGALADPEVFDAVLAQERHELARRERLFRGDRAPPALAGRSVVLVDDGLATGSTMLVAVRAARAAGATEVIAAAPVGSREAAARIAAEADVTVVPSQPDPFFAVGEWYAAFPQVEDDEVRRLLAAPAAGAGASA